jgi:hypothetical protein
MPLVAAPSHDTSESAELGLVPATRIRVDRTHPDEELDELCGLAERADWRSVADRCEAAAADWERWDEVVSALADLSIEDDAWLAAWVDARPDDAVALTVQGRALYALAWKIRTNRRAADVMRDQWEGFHRLLRQAPAICERAAALRPEDPTALVTMLGVATGAGWSREGFRSLWGRVCERDPLHVAAHQAAMIYWLPRWRDSAEPAAGFLNDALGSAPSGSLLTVVRLHYLYLEQGRTAARSTHVAFSREAVDAAIDEALADLAAAAPDRPRLPALRHWLAHHLTEVGRHAEAVEQFQLVGGYCGALPWKYSDNPVEKFTAQRAKAVAGWEKAGRPAPPRR